MSDQQPLILIAEDHELNLGTMVDVLEFSGFRVLQARNGQEAVDQAKENNPDLILMDVQMPILDGLAATRQLREFEGTKTMPIVALTGLAMEGDAERCLNAGANAYLSKPINFDTLINTINKHVSVPADAA